jgi:hypothetical protein
LRDTSSQVDRNAPSDQAFLARRLGGFCFRCGTTTTASEQQQVTSGGVDVDLGYHVKGHNATTFVGDRFAPEPDV